MSPDRFVDKETGQFWSGYIPPKVDNDPRLPMFSAGYSLIDRSKWEEFDLATGLDVPVLDQGQHGSCVGHGSTTAFWYAYLIMGGTVPVGGFSPTSMYALINGGRDGGAVVSDAMDEGIKTGFALMSDYPESVIFDRNLSAATLAKVNAERPRFRIAEAYNLNSFDDMGSAEMLGFSIAFGISISGRFMSPPASGIIPAGGFPIGGHCLAGKGLKSIGSGLWAINTRNSWNKSWGLSGDCYLPEGHFGRGLDAFAIKAAKLDPLDPNMPPPAP